MFFDVKALPERERKCVLGTKRFKKLWKSGNFITIMKHAMIQDLTDLLTFFFSSRRNSLYISDVNEETRHTANMKELSFIWITLVGHRVTFIDDKQIMIEQMARFHMPETGRMS